MACDDYGCTVGHGGKGDKGVQVVEGMRVVLALPAVAAEVEEGSGTERMALVESKT